MLNTDITVKIDQFDGPLALLLYLVQKEEMEIEALDLTAVTGQYLNYLATMKDLNFDIAGDFLFMASTLVYLKSKKSDNGSHLEQPILVPDPSWRTANTADQGRKTSGRCNHSRKSLHHAPRQTL